MVAFLWNQQKKKEAEIVEEIKVPVILTQPEFRTLEKTIHFRGFVESDHTVNVYPQSMGILQSVLVEEGEKVEAGQLIAVLDNEAARLNLKQAEVAYNLAREDWNRYKNMYEQSLISQQQYQNVESNYQAKKAQFELATVQYEYSQVTSPITGVIQRVNMEPGVLVSSQVNLMSIFSQGNNIIKVDIPEKYYEFFSSNPDMEVQIYRPGNSQEIYEAHIQYVSPYIARGTMKFQVTLELNDQGIMIPGMYTEAAFIIERKENQLSLPYNVLTRKGELWSVDDQNRVHSIDLNEPFQGDRFFALPQEFQDHQFIAEGQHFLTEGQEVNIRNRD